MVDLEREKLQAVVEGIAMDTDPQYRGRLIRRLQRRVGALEGTVAMLVRNMDVGKTHTARLFERENDGNDSDVPHGGLGVRPEPERGQSD